MKTEPGVSTQPPAFDNEEIGNDKHLPSGYTVCLNCGLFDWPVKSFVTKNAAEIYYLLFRALCRQDLIVELKPDEEIRYLRERFVQDDICTGIRVMKCQVLSGVEV